MRVTAGVLIELGKVAQDFVEEFNFDLETFDNDDTFLWDGRVYRLEGAGAEFLVTRDGAIEVK